MGTPNTWDMQTSSSTATKMINREVEARVKGNKEFEALSQVISLFFKGLSIYIHSYWWVPYASLSVVTDIVIIGWSAVYIGFPNVRVRPHWSLFHHRSNWKLKCGMDRSLFWCFRSGRAGVFSRRKGLLNNIIAWSDPARNRIHVIEIREPCQMPGVHGRTWSRCWKVQKLIQITWLTSPNCWTWPTRRHPLAVGLECIIKFDKSQRWWMVHLIFNIHIR